MVVDEEKRTMTQSRVHGGEIMPFVKSDTLEFALKMQSAQCFLRGYTIGYRVLVESEGIHLG